MTLSKYRLATSAGRSRLPAAQSTRRARVAGGYGRVRLGLGLVAVEMGAADERGKKPFVGHVLQRHTAGIGVDKPQDLIEHSLGWKCLLVAQTPEPTGILFPAPQLPRRLLSKNCHAVRVVETHMRRNRLRPERLAMESQRREVALVGQWHDAAEPEHAHKLPVARTHARLVACLRERESEEKATPEVGIAKDHVLTKPEAVRLELGNRRWRRAPGDLGQIVAGRRLVPDIADAHVPNCMHRQGWNLRVVCCRSLPNM